MPTYDQIDTSTRGLINEVMRSYHFGLAAAGVKVAALFAHAPRDQHGNPKGPALKYGGGYAAAGMIKILSLKDRVLGVGDALMYLDGDQWGDWSHHRRRALIDHELCHVQVKWVVAPEPDESGQLAGGVPETDDWHRPKLQRRLHDWQMGGFHEIAGRWGKHAFDVEHFEATFDHYGQYLLPYLQLERAFNEEPAK